MLPAVMILLTAAYLVLTAGGVGAPIASKNTTITYDTAPITYGDVQFMSESNFADSYYGKKNGYTNTSFYTSQVADTSSSSTFQMYDRYANITFNEHAAPTGTKIEDFAYSDFYHGYTETSVVTVGAGTLPVLNTTGTGTYTVVPGSKGDYYVYVYSASDPTGNVRYTLLDSAADANAFGKGEAAAAKLAFSNVSGNWWRAKAPITVSVLGWQAFQPKCDKSSVNQSDSKGDSGIGAAVAESLSNDTLSQTYNYYYNVWSYTCANYDTLLVLEWDSNAQIALVGKEGNISVSNGANGTVSVQTAFGETVSGKAVHAPIYVTGTAASGYVFGGLTGADGAAVETALIDTDTVSYSFMSDVTLTAAWEKTVALPGITVALNDATLTGLNFLTAKTGSTTFVGGTDAVYTFTADFTNNPDAVVSYDVTGETTAGGTLTKNVPSCTVSGMWANSTVTFTVSQGGKEYTITYTMKCMNIGSAVAVIEETGDTFTYLEDALVAANSVDAARTVVVLRDVSFYTGTPNVSWTNNNAGYTIGSNVTLLVPYAPNATTVDTETATEGISGKLIHANKTFVASNTNALDTEYGKYLTVTVPSGITLEIEGGGKFVIGGTIGSTGGISGATVGDHSNVILDGTINVANGGIISCCGYILGEGTIYAASGAEIYQPFVIMDYKGGSFTTAANGSIAPFTRFTMQNIQATVKINDGAMIYGYCDMYTGASVIPVLNISVAAQHNVTTALVVGGSTTGAAVLKLSAGAILTSTYDEDAYVSSYDKVGKTKLEITGGAALGKMELTVSVAGSIQSVSTAGVMFPLPYNYDIHLNGANSTYTMGYSFGILPGASVTVGNGATLNVGSQEAGFQFMVFDGLYDHTSTGASVTYGQNIANNYPTTEVIQSAPFNGTGAGSLVVNGKLNILSGTNFGGVLETGSTTGVVEMDSAAVASCKTIVGMVSGDYAGRTERTLKAEVVDTGTGLRTAMVAGKTYQAKEGSAILPTYTYTLYTENGKSESHTETLNALVSGGWYNYSATVIMVDSEGHELSSYPIWFCHNANTKGMGLYTDKACTSEVTSVTTDDLTLYAITDDAQAMLNGEDYFPTLLQAVKNATGNGDVVTVLNPLTMSQSIPVDKAQTITVDLGGNNVNYSATPFINDGTLTLKLSGATISNKVGDVYTVAPAFTNNTSGTATLDLGGGSIIVQAPAGNTAQLEGVVNYGTLTVKDGSAAPGGIYVYSDLGTAGKDYVLDTNYNTTTYPKVQVNAELAAQNMTAMPIYVGIYNTGTLASLQDVTVHSPLIGVYNGAAAHIRYPMTGINTKAVPEAGEVKSTIESISGTTVEGGWAGVLNAFATVEEISDGSLIRSTGKTLVTDAAASYAALMNYMGEVKTISDSTIQSSDALTLVRYRYLMNGVNVDLGEATLNSAGTARAGVVTNTSYGIYNVGWIAADATKAEGHNLRISSVGAIIDSTIKGTGTSFNADQFIENADQITKYYGEAPNNANAYGIYNMGGTVGDITGGSVTGNRGIYNINMVYTTTLYGDNQTNSNYIWKKDTRIVPEEAVGSIGDLIDCTVHGTYDYGILNYGMIGTIGGETEIKVTPAVTRGYAISNAGTWYGTNLEEAIITEREVYDSSKYRAKETIKLYQNFTAPAETFADVEAYWDSIDVPTIEAITGNAQIRAINHSGSNEYARGLINAGRINSISGNAKVSAEKLEGGKTSSYALYNNGGYIGEISGSAEFVAQTSYGAINTANRLGKEVATLTYSEGTTKATTTTERTYATPAYIASITGATFETETATYGLQNSGWIKTMSGCTFSAATQYGIYNNYTSGAKTYDTMQVHVLADTESERTKASEENLYYEVDYGYFESWIGTILDSTITAATSDSIYNGGRIDLIDGCTMEVTTASTSTSRYNLRNGESNVAGYTERFYTLGRSDEVNASRYITLTKKDYRYVEGGPQIGTITGSTFNNSTMLHSVYNTGTVGTIEDSELHTRERGIYNGVGPYSERSTFRYLYSTSKIATSPSQYIGEQAISYFRERAKIRLLDNVAVDASVGAGSLMNYGWIGTVQDSDFTATTYNALVNGITGTYEYTLTDQADDSYLANVALKSDSTGYTFTAKNREETYTADHVGAIDAIVNTTFTGNAVAKSNAVVNNAAVIGSIDGAEITGTPASGVIADRAVINKGTIGTVTNSLINAVNSYALENIGSYVSAKTTPYAAGVAGTAVSTTVYASIAELGEGNEFAAGKQYAVRNETNNTIGEISGGIYTSTGKYALYNNSTTNAILLTGGDFKGGTALSRTDAVYSPDATTRYIYPEGMGLTKQGIVEEVTFADGSTGTDYYFIGPANFVAKIVKMEGDVEKIQGWYTTLQDAVNAYKGSTSYIQLQEGTGETAVQVDRDIYLDLNGHSVTGTIYVEEGNILYGLDKGTDGYEDYPKDGVVCAIVSGDVAAAADHPGYAGELYVAYTADTGEEKAYTFNRASIYVSDYYVEARRDDLTVREEGKAAHYGAVGFGATFRGNTDAAAALTDIGFEIREGTKEPFKVWAGERPEELKDTYKVYCTFEVSAYGEFRAHGSMQFGTGTEAVVAYGGKEERMFNFTEVLKAYYATLDPEEPENAKQIAVLNAFAEKTNIRLTAE